MEILQKIVSTSYTHLIFMSTTVDQWTRNSSRKHNFICIYNDVPTTCFGRFLTGHHQVGIQCQRNSSEIVFQPGDGQLGNGRNM